MRIRAIFDVDPEVDPALNDPMEVIDNYIDTDSLDVVEAEWVKDPMRWERELRARIERGEAE